MGRVETEKLGVSFVLKVSRQRVLNPRSPYFAGVIELSEPFKPNMIRTGIETPYYSQLFYGLMKNFHRKIRKLEQVKFQEKLVAEIVAEQWKNRLVQYESQ